MKKAIPKKCWTQKNNPNNKPRRSKALGTKKHAKSSTEFTQATLPKKRAHSRCLPENTQTCWMLKTTQGTYKKKANRKTPATGWMLKKRKTVLVNTMEMPQQPQKRVRD